MRRLLESKPFAIDRGLRPLLKPGPLPEKVALAFVGRGCRLARTGNVIITANGWKWKIRTGPTTYVVRDAGECLLVARERVPIVSRLITVAQQAAARVAGGTRDRLFFAWAIFRKRYVDRPPGLLINVGAGKWYQPQWKVIDHVGDWYRYPRRFVDYPIDIMTKTPFPFPDQSVDLFYSEHVLEHFPDDVCAFVLAEMFRTLKLGGGTRIVVPDADLLCEKFRVRAEPFFEPWMTSHNTTQTGAFLILVGRPEEPFDQSEVEKNFRTMEREVFLNHCTANLRYDYARAGEHINWFNFDKLDRMLTQAGFAAVSRSQAQQSRFQEVRGRKFDTRPSYSLHVDATT